MGRRGGLAVAAVLALLSETYRLAVYSALSYLSSQLLVAALRPDIVRAVASWQEDLRHSAWSRCRGAVRVACLCGACAWYVPRSWLSQASGKAEKVSCRCTQEDQEDDDLLCPNRRACKSYISWLTARFGFQASSLQWLWLPPGPQPLIGAGRAPQVEPVGDVEPCAKGLSQRFRCKICQVLTHAEVMEEPSGSSEAAAASPRVLTVLVTTYEVLRAAAARQGPAAKANAADALQGVDDIPSEGDAVPHARGMCRGLLVSRQSCRPPQRLAETALSEVVLPGAQLDHEW